jgi:hypothetical protein
MNSSISSRLITRGGDITMASRVARITRPLSKQWLRQRVPTLPTGSKCLRVALSSTS